ncbi:MAG: hypothetical protein EBT13_09645 [Rhodobacteraceae bacterium]|nr:hypothetical protein [Paracoccaceae bacterium]
MQKLIVFTDIHIKEPGETIIGLDPSERFSQALDQALDRHPDARAIVIMGDLTHHGRPAQYARLAELLADVPVPVIPMIGNHDRRDAFLAAFPDAQFTIWNRTAAAAHAMAAKFPGMQVAQDLETAVRAADIVTSATMSTEPLLRGAWFQPGQHIDLIGAYRPDMREADDEALLRARVFVDSYDTTVGHIGEIKTPIESGVIARSHVLADYYQPQAFQRHSADEITLFKNGGGAHLDLMTSRYILQAWQAAGN